MLTEERKLTMLVWCFISLGYILSANCRVTASPYRDLYKELFQDYNTEIIPRCKMEENVSVTVNVALRKIIDVNEVEQSLYLKFWTRLKWVDCFLKWNTTDYNNISSIALNAQSVWTPDIVLYESISEDLINSEERVLRVVVNSDGEVWYNFPSIIVIACSIDVTFFPYDTQNCSLRFSSWTQPGDVIDVVKSDSDIFVADLGSFLVNNEWTVISMEGTRHVIYYGCCSEPYPDVTYYLVISRKPKFYIVTLLMPCIFVLVLAAVGLVLPSESGEKMSLQISILLSLAVYLLIITEKLPASSETFPILGVYVTLTMALVTISCLLSIFVLCMYYRDDSRRRVPKWLRKLCLGPCFQSEKPMHHNEDEYTKRGEVSMTELKDSRRTEALRPPLDAEQTMGNGGPSHITAPREGDISSTNTKKEWHELARRIDKLLLIVFSVISAITSAVFITEMRRHE